MLWEISSSFVTSSVSNTIDYLLFFVDSDDTSFGIDMNDKILQELEAYILIMCTTIMDACKTHNTFILIELEEGGQKTVNRNVGVRNELSLMCDVLALLKFLLNFEVYKLDELLLPLCVRKFATMHAT